MAGSGFSASTEVEASSFSVWNCVITFLQILLISTMLYGAGWNQGQVMYNVPPETLVRFQHYRAIAFFFCGWSLQSVALALLLVWAIGKKSYHLCHSWMLCEVLMQGLIILSAMYFTYHSLLFGGRSLLPDSNYSNKEPDTVVQDTFRLPKHLIFLIILHFLIKVFGFWIVWRYMKLLKTRSVQALVTEAISANVSQVVLPSPSLITYERQMSPPPSYAYLCKDDLPCYDEALRLCLTNGDDHDTSNHPNHKKCVGNTPLLQLQV